MWRQPQENLELVERSLQRCLGLGLVGPRALIALERLVDLHRSDLPAGKQRFVLAQILLLAEKIRLRVANRLHLRQERQVTTIERGDRGPELLAEAIEVAGGVEHVAFRLREHFQAHPLARVAQ